MSYSSNILAGHLGYTVRLILADNDAAVITKNKGGAAAAATYNVQGLNEKLQEPDARLPVYRVRVVPPPAAQAHWPNQYKVVRTLKGADQHVAQFKHEEDANEYAKMRNAKAKSEVKDRYTIERRGAWLCILDSEKQTRFPVAKFASAYEVTARGILRKMNEAI
ncbi:hypothetical protein XaavBphi31_20 [Xanthomonas phage Xaa_vB_phi31]|uniref:Uncharacterized protein n=1 Tax=Xanthomonas phage Xaa_vB_phi31 TaxID=2776752 RepID=A0A868BZH2_9CAUD|nr:hypothetical protein XaavBphi31_20 [Xanthomonas phage Xaa_vB_phi31]